MSVASALCKRDAKTERKSFGELLPCRKMSPLEPFIKLEEYFMLERDNGKYLLYISAIDHAISDIIQSKANTEEVFLNCFVLGPGLGRLVRFCIDSAQYHGIPVCVHVIEANPTSVEFLKKSFEKEIFDKIVVLYEPFVFHPKVTSSDLPMGLQMYCGHFDLIVSELLGCFGDDEFLPELTASLHNLFLNPKTGIMIPDTWTNYLVPVSCPTTYQYLKSNGKSLNAGYTMGLPRDCIFLSDTRSAWSGDCKMTETQYSCELDFELDFKHCLEGVVVPNQSKDFAKEKEYFHCDELCQATKLSSILFSEVHEKNSLHKIVVSTKSKDKDKKRFHGYSCFQEPMVPSMISSSKSSENCTRCHNDESSLLGVEQERIGKYENDCNDCKNDETLNECNDSDNLNDDGNITCQANCNGNTFGISESIVSHGTNNDITSYRLERNASEGLIESESNHGNVMTHPKHHGFMHGFIGYFTSTLYKDIIIDTRHTSETHNAFHWECYFVPLPRPVLVGHTSRVRLSMARKTALVFDSKLKLWYEWQATVESQEDLCGHALKIKRSKPCDVEEVVLGSSQHNHDEIAFRQSTNKETSWILGHGRDNEAIFTGKKKLSLQNRNGDDDSVYLTFHKCA